MGHIKEPKGVDFIIKSEPLTDKERKAISEFIKADKEKMARQKLRKRTTAKRIIEFSRNTGRSAEIK